MSKYEKITRYIDAFDRESFGKWNEQIGDGTENNPFVMPYFIYENDVKDFIESFYDLNIADLNYHDNVERLKERPLESLNESESITMLTYIIRGDRFCEGLINSKLSDGSIQTLLQNLKKY